MIHIDNLSVHYGDRLALCIDEPVTFNAGDRVGVIGSNGAGKTTLINALLGLIPATGTFHLDAKPEDIGVHMQHNEYSSNVPVRNVMNLILGCKPEAHPIAAKLIDYFNFSHCLGKRFEKMSGGEKQKMTLILVLAKETPLVFFDEVTTGLDFVSRDHLMQLLRDWYTNRDATLVFITHYYKEIENLVNKLLILDRGRLLAFGHPQELFRTYCGERLFITEKTAETEKIFADVPILPLKDELALRPDDAEAEAVFRLLEKHHLSYRRCHMDIEILAQTVMAKKGVTDE
ncbi:MAG: ABC transporter ATP-binding protein [Eubacteriales bacterium]|nr:ABC transporter ATP-binding protein [Eubacteriales bacterium]